MLCTISFLISNSDPSKSRRFNHLNHHLSTEFSYTFIQSFIEAPPLSAYSMATAMSPSYYTTTTMVPVTTPNVGSRLGPQIHQYTQPSGPHYQQQYSQEPQIFERIVNVTRRSTIEETLQLPIRQFVSFKNLRHRNKLGQQWEYCEHVSISLKPEELERKVRAHEQSGNDLVNLFVSMCVP